MRIFPCRAQENTIGLHHDGDGRMSEIVLWKVSDDVIDDGRVE